MDDLSAFDEAPQVTNSAALNSLIAKAKEWYQLEKQAADLDELLKTIKGRINELKTKELPEKFKEVGIPSFTTPGGHTISIESFVAGSLPKEPEKRKIALEELKDWGAESIIRNEVLMVFDKKQHNEAMAIVDDLRAKGFTVEVDSGVHPQTYLATMRERLARGEEIDAEKMGVFIGERAKIEKKKNGKGKAK
jgi:hypothetical protein